MQSTLDSPRPSETIYHDDDERANGKQYRRLNTRNQTAMKLSTQDENYFRVFARLAHDKQARLEDYYIMIQRSDRDERGAVTTLRTDELHGLSLARDHIQRDETCLIVGCGCGVEASWLIANSITNVTGLDISESVLATCEKLTGIKTVCGDMRKTGLPDQSYDVVLTHRSLHHLFYPFQALEEFSRIAKKKVLILNEPVRSALKVAVRLLTNTPIISGANIYEYQFDREDVHRYMAFNGFKLAETIRYWETTQSTCSNWLLNCFSRGIGNRFSAIYERFGS